MRINYNEANGLLRRVPVYLYTSLRQPYINAVPVGAQIQVSLSGASWVNAAGSWVELSDGTYYYQATQAETLTNSFLWLKVTIPGTERVEFVVNIGDRIQVSEFNPLKRYIPIYLTDSSGIPVQGLNLNGSSQVKISKNGSGLIDVAGDVFEIGGIGNGKGGYCYEATAGDVSSTGYCLIRAFPTSLPQSRYVYEFNILDSQVSVPSVTFRMRAKDETLNTTVFWNSTTIDATGSFYAGPGPITDIVIQNIEC